jgi:bisphosphoglycerate-dependent phosphoglycerate mutase
MRVHGAHFRLYPLPDPRYADVPKDELPTCESLELTIKRALPYWNDVIAPQLREGKKVRFDLRCVDLRCFPLRIG